MFDTETWTPPTEQGYYDDDNWWVDTTPNPWDGTEERWRPIPEGVDSLLPGPELADVVSGVDRASTSGYDLITLVQAQQRLVSHFQAEFYRSIAELSSLEELPDDGLASSEVAAALHLTRTAADNEYHFALQLARHPELLDELSAGRLDVRRVRVILEHISTMDSTHARSLIAEVLPAAREMTTGQLRAKAKRIAMNLNPEQAVRNYEFGLEDRRVVVTANPDGTANLLLLNAPPTEIDLARQRLEELSRNGNTPEDPRNMDQVRADTLLDLLIGKTAPDQSTATIHVVVELETLMGLADNPGEIPGYGPIISEVARKAAARNANGRWEYVVTDQGQPISTGTVKRRPTEGMKRRIRAQYPTCVHPGCRRPARQSDIDHTVEWAKDGKTRLGNLAPLCEYHHQLKDHGWAYRIRPDGTIKWTSPLGHTYITTGQSP